MSTDRPLLPKSSYTARQLYCARPKAVHARSRVLFIGQIPSDYLVKAKSRWRSWKHVKSAINKQKKVASKIDFETVLGFSMRAREKLNPQKLVNEEDNDEVVDDLEDPKERTANHLQDQLNDVVKYTGKAARHTEAKLMSYKDRISRRKRALQQHAMVMMRERQHCEEANLSEEEKDEWRPMETPSRVAASDIDSFVTARTDFTPVIAPEQSHEIAASVVASELVEAAQPPSRVRQESIVVPQIVEPLPLEMAEPAVPETPKTPERKWSSMFSSTSNRTPRSPQSHRSPLSHRRAPSSLSSPSQRVQFKLAKTPINQKLDDVSEDIEPMSSASSSSSSSVASTLSHVSYGASSSNDSRAISTILEALHVHDSDSDGAKSLDVRALATAMDTFSTSTSADQASFGKEKNIWSTVEQVDRDRKLLIKKLKSGKIRAPRYLKSLLTAADPKRRMDLGLFHKKRGEVLFRDTFAVQVREISNVGSVKMGHVITETECPASTCVDHWKEYVVVARYSGHVVRPVNIYLYHMRKEKAIDSKLAHRWSHSRKYKLKLSSDFRANFYSSLDLSLGLYEVGPETEKISLFIFAATSRDLMASWLFFLQNSIQRDMPVAETMSIRVPDLQLDIDIPSDVYFAATEESARQHAKASILEETDAEKLVSYEELLSPIAQPTKAGSEIMSQIYKILESLPKSREVQQAWDDNCKYAMAWRRFDRLKWMDNRKIIQIITTWSMTDSYRMELRRQQDDTDVIYGDEVLEEPPALEGFGWQIKTMKASEKKDMVSKRYYFHTHSHLLMLSKTKRAALPMIKYKDKAIVATDEANLQTELSGLPDKHYIEPYGLDKNGDISWLASGTDYELNDGLALFEAERRTQVLGTASTAYDMRTIKSVEPLSDEQTMQLSFDGGNHVWLRLQTVEIRDLWVEELGKAARYWKAKYLQDCKRIQEINRRNMVRFELPSQMMLQTIAQWESDMVEVDELSFLPFPQRFGRSIKYSGYIFQKTSKFKTFRCYYAILTSTSFVLLHVKYRPSQQRPDYYYRHASGMSIKGCYVFSGNLSNDYLLGRTKKYVDKENPGVEALPRAWPDGWHSPDTEMDRCFVLWSQRNQKKRQRMICLARSRVERDLWVTCIQDVLTELASSEDEAHAK